MQMHKLHIALIEIEYQLISKAMGNLDRSFVLMSTIIAFCLHLYIFLIIYFNCLIINISLSN